MSEVSETLLSLLLSEGILDYFELTKAGKDGEGLHIYLQEKDIISEDYDHKTLESKGFLPESVVQDFPIRGQKPFYTSKGVAKSTRKFICHQSRNTAYKGSEDCRFFHNQLIQYFF